MAGMANVRWTCARFTRDMGKIRQGLQAAHVEIGDVRLRLAASRREGVTLPESVETELLAELVRWSGVV